MNNLTDNGTTINFCDTLRSVAKAEPFAEYGFYHTGKDLPDRGCVGLVRNDTLADDNLIIGLFILMFCIIAVVTGHYKHFIAHRIKGFFTQKRTYADESADINRNELTNTIMLTSVAAISLALTFINMGGLAERSFEIAGVELSGHTTLAALALGLLAFIGVKSILYHIVNSVFFHRDDNSNWQSAYYLLTSITAYILYPLALISVFDKPSDNIVTFCLLFALILYETLLLYKLCANFKTKKSGILLFFLYFCSVEIMPTLILAHIGANISNI